MWIEIDFVIRYIRSRLTVTPLAGVWIEIIAVSQMEPIDMVTPLAGVWIEIAMCTDIPVC